MAERRLHGACFFCWLVPQTEEPGPVPAGPGDGEGDLGEARIGLAVPGKAIGQHRHAVHSSVPLPRQHGAWPDTRGDMADVHRPLTGRLGRGGIIQKAPAVAIQVAEVVSLQPVGQDPEQQMARQVRGRLPPEHGQPAGAERAEIEIAKSRDLDIERVTVQRDRDDFDCAACRSSRTALGRWTTVADGLTLALDAVDALAVDLGRMQLQLQLLADDAGQEAANRMRLPSGLLHDGGDSCTGG